MSEELKKPEENMTSIPEADVSKVKVRHILGQRIKKCGAKRIIAVILLAAVCFGGGIFTDRLILNHGYGRNFYGRYGFQHNMNGRNSFGKGNSRFNNNSNGNQSSSQNQNQQPTK